MEEKNDFISLLNQLKMSSKHAIIDGDKYSLNEFKEYLHVERNVEQRLKKIIEESAKSNSSKLVLICGNVGDGKSHILSYLNDLIGDNFNIHNDATESFNPKESFAETLNKSLLAFKDVNIEKNDTKTILAINLGTLTNFLDSNGDEYQQLKKYVEKKGILNSDKVLDDDFESESIFQYVNFADYQLYELTKEGVQSSLVENIFLKIFDTTDSNPLYKAFLKFKDECQHNALPIVFNYLFLTQQKNRDIVINLMIKAIVKSKGIISLRAIFNFIYDIIIPINYSTFSFDDFKDESDLKSTSLIKDIIPFYIFNNPGLSNVFSIISDEDPCHKRSEKVDDSLIELINSTDLESFIKKYYLNNLDYANFLELYTDSHSNTQLITKLHVRLLYFQNENEFGLTDANFNDYIKFLYGLNVGEKAAIKQFYNIVINACKKWNGNPNESNSIIVEVARKQKKYRLLQPFKPEPSIRDIVQRDLGIISKFFPQLIVKFKGIENELIQLHIDSGLLELLIKVNNGYRPNKLDKNSYVNFINFLNKLIESEKNNEKYRIDEVNIGKSVDYIFSLDSFGDEYSFSIA